MELRELLEDHLAEAYMVAKAVTRRPEDAEDAVGDAVDNALSHPGNYDSSRPFRSYFLRSVVNAARQAHRASGRRKIREKAVMNVKTRTDDAMAPERRETLLAVRTALAGLPAEQQSAVLLTHVSDFSQQQTGEILGLSQRAVSRRVRRGLEALRQALSGAGFAGLAIAGVLRGIPRDPVPASLAGRVEALVAQGGAKTAAAGAVTSASATAKGGMTMKLIAGVVLAGAVAAGVAVVSGTGGDLPAEKPKFAIPVWHPDARWERDPEQFMGSGALGYLDGPRREVMWHIIGTADASPIFNSDESYPYGFFSYDTATERVHITAGGATQRGHLDGPIARARFGGFDYSHRVSACASPDGRYYFFTEPYLNGALRRLDLEKQEVKTLYRDIPWGKQPRGMTCDSKGRLYMMIESGLQITDLDGKVEKTLPLVKEDGPLFTWPLALDEKRNRLYSAGGVKKKWHVWYWDLADGSFHGVLPFPQPGEGRPDAIPMSPSAGPFKGTVLYTEMGCGFGPDDPEKNFLYLYPNDTNTFVRLDLEKEQVWLFSGEKEARWIPTGKPKNVGPWMHMDAEFNIVGYKPPWEGSQALRFKRVK